MDSPARASFSQNPDLPILQPNHAQAVAAHCDAADYTADTVGKTGIGQVWPMLGALPPVQAELPLRTRR